MKSKANTSVTVQARFVFALGITVVLGAFVHPGSANGQELPRSVAENSARAKNFVSESWNSASFMQGIAIVADAKEAPTSRAAAMNVLHSNRRKLTVDEMRTLLGEATRLAKDISLDDTNSAFAVSIMANMALTMRDQGHLSDAESKQEAGFLMETATNSRRTVQLRAAAISALGILRIEGAREVLRDMLTNSTSYVAEIVRPACLSLVRIDGERAIPDLTDVLRRSDNVRIFGTAAFALGQIKKRECVSALVESLGRYPDSGACDAALVDMDDVIGGILKDPNDENLNAAIQATRYLWRDGQREAYTPQLRDLLSTAPLAARKATVERLLESASCLDFESEKQELALVLNAIRNQSELQDYQERVRNRLSAGKDRCESERKPESRTATTTQL